jgi:hypothetical protein
VSELPNDVFLNGVPHAVQTSELTKNAINPRNAFIDHEKNQLDDMSADFAKHAFDPIKALQMQPESSEVKPSQSNYPSTQDSFDTHDLLSVSKTHLTDNMQSLHQKSASENRQLIEQASVEDNFQKLAPTLSRRDTILYKEKKNIHTNLQKIEASNSAREPATLVQTVQSEKKSDLNAHALHADSQLPTKSASSRLLVEDKLRARVRKMKENIGQVNRTLKEIEEDK